VERAVRKDLIRGLRQHVLKDANANIDSGLLDGPSAFSATCSPSGVDPLQDLSVTTGQYDCLAVNKTDTDGTQEGWRYSGGINFKTGDYRWRLGGGGL
jgi:hypothetical protein